MPVLFDCFLSVPLGWVWAGRSSTVAVSACAGCAPVDRYSLGLGTKSTRLAARV